MRFQNLVQLIQAGCCLLGLVMLPGCVTTSPTDALLSVPCAVTTSTNENPPSTSQDQATTQALQKRLQKNERTIAAQTHRIEVLSNQLEALKQIDQETRRQPRKRLTYPTP
jgi:hypothetical protein